MSIFNNIRTLKVSPELDLLLTLKYGEPNPSDEYFDRLPDAVVNSAFSKIIHHDRTTFNHSIPAKKQSLSIMLRQPVNKNLVKESLCKALIEYHTLLNRL